MFRQTKAAGINVQNVIKLLKIANNNLPAVESRLEQVKGEIASLEAAKRNSARTFQELSDEITYLRKLSREQSIENSRLAIQKVRLETFVKGFQDKDEEFLKIK